jgi:ABC-type sugar transport system substrate-binding protein
VYSSHASIHKASSKRWHATTTVVLLFAILLAICTLPSKGSTASGQVKLTASARSVSRATCISDAQTYLKPYASPATTLGSGFTPLPRKPTRGKTVVFVYQGNISAILGEYQGLKAATAAAGWVFKGISYDGTPAGLTAGIEQAITEKPYAIYFSGTDPSAIPNAIHDAKAAGIVVEDTSVLTAPQSYPGYAVTTIGAGANRLAGTIIANWVMADSKCTANVAIFAVTNLPILNPQTDAFLSTIKAKCAACKTSYTLLPISELETPALTSSIVAKLQSSPATKYVLAASGFISDGLPAALSQAGIKGLKIVGNVPSDQSIADLRSGGTTMWVSESSVLAGWIGLNALLRASETGKMVNSESVPRYTILTQKNVGKMTTVPIYPVNYSAEFKKLWKVG